MKHLSTFLEESKEFPQVVANEHGFIKDQDNLNSRLYLRKKLYNFFAVEK
jgi:hypothetical protein